MLNRAGRLISLTAAAVIVGACVSGSGDDADDGGSETTTDTDASVDGLGDDYAHPSGCFTMQIGDNWDQVDETGLGVEFSADPHHPLTAEPDLGEEGLWVSAPCAPLDQVGPDVVPAIPGADVDQEAADFGGGDGVMRILVFTDPAGERDDESVRVEYSVDRNDARCILRVDGDPASIESFRDEFDLVASTYSCNGR